MLAPFGLSTGSLRHRITFQTLTQTPDSTNQPVDTWTDYVSVWAEIKPLSGRELVVAQAIKAEVSHAITCRYLGSSYSLDPTMRCIYQGRIFNVESVVNRDERNYAYDIIATEVKV